MKKKLTKRTFEGYESFEDVQKFVDYEGKYIEVINIQYSKPEIGFEKPSHTLYYFNLDENDA